MTPSQRAAAERLAAYHAEQADHFSPFGSGNALTIFHGEAAALLRELLAATDAENATVEPVQEPVAWGVFVDDELFKPFNCKDEAVDWFQAQYNHGSRYDYLVLPLYAAPQQPMHCPKDGGECGAGGYCRPEPKQRSRALADAGFTRRPSLKAMEMRAALEMIAAPMRPDGTWNRDRDACRELAAEVLGRYDDSKTPNVRANLTKGAADE